MRAHQKHLALIAALLCLGDPSQGLAAAGSEQCPWPAPSELKRYVACYNPATSECKDAVVEHKFNRSDCTMELVKNGCLDLQGGPWVTVPSCVRPSRK